MTITTDFVGNEGATETVSRVAAIADYYGVTPQNNWGDIRAGFNQYLATPIANGELAGSFLPKINSLNRGDMHWLNDLGGVVMWYDPSDLSTLFQDRAGTVPVTAPGQLVGVQRDKGPGGFHKTAINDAARGTLARHPATGIRNLANGAAAVADTSFWPAVSTNNGITRTVVGTGVDVDGLPYVDFAVTGTATGVSFLALYNRIASRSAAAMGQSWFASGLAKVTSASPLPADCGVRFDLIGETAGLANSENHSGSLFSSTVEGPISVAPSGGTLSGANTALLSLPVQARTASGATVDYVVRLKGMQFEQAAARSSFQANYSAFDITEAGVADTWSIRTDGLNTGYVTPTVTPGTDKVEMFAAVRKLSDAALGVVYELGIGGTNQTAGLAAPAGATPTYRQSSQGTVFQQAVSPSSFAAPITNVLAGRADISGDTVALRVNGSQVAETIGDQGVGNYGAAPIYFYRRGGTSFPFNGNAYGEVVRFGPPLTAAQIAQTERWLAGKCGVTL